MVERGGVKDFLRRWKGREEELKEIPDEPPWPRVSESYPEPGYYAYGYPSIDWTGKPTKLSGVIISIPTLSHST